MTHSRQPTPAVVARKPAGAEWWPMRRFLSAPLDRRALPIWATWLALTAVSITSAFLEATFNWSGMPYSVFGHSLGVTVYPPVAISAFVAFWLGPTYGATTAYASSLVSGLVGGLAPDRSAFFALGTPAEVLLLWFLATILRVHPALRGYRDWWRFSAAAIIATTASSLDIMLYNEAHQVPLVRGQRLWEGWIFGDIAQLCLIVAPLLWLIGDKAHRLTLSRVGSPRRELSARNTVLLVGFVWMVLGGLALFGFRLVARTLEGPELSAVANGTVMPPLAEIETFFVVFVGALLLSTMALTAALAARGEQVVAMSLRDDLTGAFNRRAFRTLFEREEERSRAVDRPISIISFDLDHFKEINDMQGHAEGDRVLVAVTTEAQSILRPQDLLFRWGGDEFLILMPHSRHEEACWLAEQLRARVETQVTTLQGSQRVTMSVGVATGRPGGTSNDELIRAADAAIYEAKAQGRNRVITTASGPHFPPVTSSVN